MEPRQVLKLLRGKLGYTQGDICKKLKVSQTRLSLIETGARGLSVPFMLEYCKSLGVPPEYIFILSENPAIVDVKIKKEYSDVIKDVKTVYDNIFEALINKKNDG